MPKSVLIVDGDPAVLAHLSAEVERRGYQVVRAYQSAQEALGWVEGGGCASVGLIDIGLADMDGTRLIAKLRRRCPAMRVLVLGLVDDAPTLVRALRAGARGYVLKSAGDDELAAALTMVWEGHTAVCAHLGARLVEHLNIEGLDEPSSDCVEDVLTPRERQVLALLCRGLTYADVARVLGIGLGTVQSYVKVIYAKLGVTSKTEATAVALARKLIDPWTE